MGEGQDDYTAALKCDSVELRAGYRMLIRNFNFALNCGESIAVVGPNGLGKTTLLRTLCGMSRPYRGNVYLGSHMLWPEKSEGCTADVCFLASQPALFLDHSVESNIEFYLRSLGRSVQQIEIGKVLKLVGLGDRSLQTARTLSTGQKRRLTLAFIHLAKPKIIFLDEPTNGLDSEGISLCLETLEATCKSGSGVVVATHDQILINWCQRQVNLKEWAR